MTLRDAERLKRLLARGRLTSDFRVGKGRRLTCRRDRQEVRGLMRGCLSLPG